VSCPSEYPLCNNNEEDDWHVIFWCSEIQQVWNDTGLGRIIEPRLYAFNNVKSLLFDICRNEDFTTAGKVAMVVWCIWYNRNNWVWNGVKDTTKEIAQRAVHMLGEWCAVNTNQQPNTLAGVSAGSHSSFPADHSVQHASQGLQMLRWQRPRDGWWKCNVDASFSQNPVALGCGWCVRDSAGMFVAAGTSSSNCTATVAEGEAKALLFAMREAVARGWTNVVFESDSKVVVDAVLSNHQGNSEWSSIVLAIKSLLRCNSNFEVKFTKRQANMAAHTLARAAYSWSSRTYFNSVPRCIEPFIFNEMS
jgi:ribonuclease HI